MKCLLCDILSRFREKWYPIGVKIVPMDLYLTPLICAIWFCDDGSIVRSKKYNGLRCSLYTDNFNKNEVEFLKELLNKTINTSFKITRKNSMNNIEKGYYIYSSTVDTIKFYNYIKDVFPSSMKRKSDKLKGYI